MKLEAVILRSTRALQPLASAVATGTLYGVTDEGDIIERSDGTTWQAYSPAVVAAGLNQLTGDVTAGPGSGSQAASIANNAVVTAKINNAAVTYAKIQDVSAISKLLGRGSAAGAGDVEELTLGTNLSMSGTTLNASGSAGLDQLTGDVTAGPGSGSQVATVKAAIRTQQIGITIDGAGVAITTGIKGFKSFPVAGTIIGVRMLADQSGSAVVDIWKDTYANYPPTVADTITASAKPTISGATKSEDNTLTGWTTAVAAGDIFSFNVDSAATITRLTLELTIVVS